MKNNPKVLASTYNDVNKTKMFTVMVDIPYVLLLELLQFKELNITYRKIEDIEVQEVLDNPFVPIWLKQENINGKILNNELPKQMWLEFLKGCDSEMNVEVNSDITIIVDYKKLGISDMYDYLLKLKVHKQNANLLLLPFVYTTCIISGTEWQNFFEVMCPHYEYDTMTFYSWKSLIKEVSLDGDLQIYNPRIYEMNLDASKRQELNKLTAQPEFQVIAEMLYDLYEETDWKESKYHIPFEDEIKKLYSERLILDYVSQISGTIKDYENEYYVLLMKISASMCAKLSYNTQDNEDSIEKHLERVNIFITQKHQESFSHQAVAMNQDEYVVFHKSMYKKIELNKIAQEIELGWCYNLRGFISQKYILENLM